MDSLAKKIKQLGLVAEPVRWFGHPGIEEFEVYSAKHYPEIDKELLFDHLLKTTFILKVRKNQRFKEKFNLPTGQFEIPDFFLPNVVLSPLRNGSFVYLNSLSPGVTKQVVKEFLKLPEGQDYLKKNKNLMLQLKFKSEDTVDVLCAYIEKAIRFASDSAESLQTSQNRRDELETAYWEVSAANEN